MAKEKIEACLRRVVLKAQANGEDVTVNSARRQTEEELKLEPGLLKTDTWKSKSKSIILAAVEEHHQEQQPEQEPPAKRRKKEYDDSTEREGSELNAVPSIEEPDQDSDMSSVIDEPPRKQKRQVRQKAKQELVEDEDDQSKPSVAITEPPTKQRRKSKQTAAMEQLEEDDASDMSVLIDEPPAKKPREPKQAKAAKKSTPAEHDPVRTLQQQLLKCGMRKRWNVELANLSESQKVSHLKRVLKDVGMTGRFSEARARQIKEARELADEIEAANDFNETWGTGEASKGRARRSAADKETSPARKASGFVDFGDSGDEGSD